MFAAIGFFWSETRPGTSLYDWAQDEALRDALAMDEAAQAAWDRVFDESALVRVIGKREVRRWQ